MHRNKIVFKLLCISLSILMVFFIGSSTLVHHENVNAFVEAIPAVASDMVIATLVLLLISYGLSFTSYDDAHATAQSLYDYMITFDTGFGAGFIDSFKVNINNFDDVYLTFDGTDTQYGLIQNWVNDNYNQGINETIDTGHVLISGDYTTWPHMPLQYFILDQINFMETGSDVIPYKHIVLTGKDDYSDNDTIFIDINPARQITIWRGDASAPEILLQKSYSLTNDWPNTSDISFYGQANSDLVLWRLHNENPSPVPGGYTFRLDDRDGTSFTINFQGDSSTFYVNSNYSLTNMGVVGTDRIDNPYFDITGILHGREAVVGVPLVESDTGIIVGDRTLDVADITQGISIGATYEDIGDIAIDTTYDTVWDLTDVADTTDVVDITAYPDGSPPSDTKWPELKLRLLDRFPFCLPWDLVATLEIFNASPVAPHIQGDIPLGYTTIHIDENMGDYPQFDILGQISRWGLLIGFTLFLISITRNLIKS